MDNKIIEKYNYPNILEVDTSEKLKEFRDHFDNVVDKALAFSYWIGNSCCRKMWSEAISKVRSREAENDAKREFTRFIYKNCKTIKSELFTARNEIKLLLEKDNIETTTTNLAMTEDHWTSPQALGEFYLDETLDSSLDGKRHLDDISKYFDYTRKAFLCITVPKRLNVKLKTHSPISNNKNFEKYITEKKYDILEIPLYTFMGRPPEVEYFACRVEIGSEYRNEFFTVPEGMSNWEISKYNAKTK